MKTGTKVEVTMGFFKGKQGKISAKPKGKKTVEEGRTFVKLIDVEEVQSLRLSILTEIK